jgi:hypothetical protein
MKSQTREQWGTGDHNGEKTREMGWGLHSPGQLGHLLGQGLQAVECVHHKNHFVAGGSMQWQY